MINKLQNNLDNFNEDSSILIDILDKIEPKKLDNWCVDVGAHNGVDSSNTYKLITEKNYNGLLIEPDKKRYKELCNNVPYDNVIKVNSFVKTKGNHSLENILSSNNINKEFDFLSIDIDGCDYFLFESLNYFKPKVVCIEYNFSIPNTVEFVQNFDFNTNQGSSALSLTLLGRRKGYTLVSSTFTNLFFLSNDYVPEKIINNPPSLNDIRNDEEFKNYIFFGYDGTLITSKPIKLPWHKIELKDLQVLPKFIRKFRDNYSFLQKSLWVLFRAIKDKKYLYDKIFKSK